MKPEEFLCPNCGHSVTVPRLVVAGYYIMDEPMKMFCPKCKYQWMVDLLIKRVFWFDHKLNEHEINNEVFKNG